MGQTRYALVPGGYLQLNQREVVPQDAEMQNFPAETIGVLIGPRFIGRSRLAAGSPSPLVPGWRSAKMPSAWGADGSKDGYGSSDTAWATSARRF